jgi:hypothetical protein
MKKLIFAVILVCGCALVKGQNKAAQWLPKYDFNLATFQKPGLQFASSGARMKSRAVSKCFSCLTDRTAKPVQFVTGFVVIVFLGRHMVALFCQ